MQLTARGKADMIFAELNSAMNGKSTLSHTAKRGGAHRLQGPLPQGGGSASASAGDAEALRPRPAKRPFKRQTRVEPRHRRLSCPMGREGRLFFRIYLI